MEAILNFDWAIFQWVEQVLWSDWLTPIMKVITTLGDGGIIWIVLGLALVISKKYRKYGIMVLVSLLFSLIINDYILKPLISRPRPFDLELWNSGLARSFFFPDMIKRPSSWSFPSGHTSSSFAAAAALWFTRKKSLIIPSTILAVLIGFSRIYVHVHYPTDVLAGIVVGILYAVLAWLLVRALEPKVQSVLQKRKAAKS